ncbi:hypothetical protein NLJ89_g5879 [Agrocybe chaxingu]|uniref:Uncharacterized protein n=1 Tax=Agrocybe chaxingu TaxID=84603 RepID=A0A9W8K081_9AGAR|nr:hypothetical protein NLJ89_g5879 [Agrocybe chaxingu]
MATTAPPAYNALSMKPPLYTIPTQFTIGSSQMTAPLVSIQEIKGHLFLLNAFAELKKRSLIATVPNEPLPEGRRWELFVALAVERFDTWCRRLKPEDSEKGPDIVLLPLDVLMVWHAYMLNPRWYTEDCLVKSECKVLKEFEHHFTNALRGQFQILLSGPPSKGRLDFWVSRTSLEFDFVDHMSSMTAHLKRIACPLCGCSVKVELLNELGTGYLQQNFAVTCPKDCGITHITKEVMALQKITDDLAAIPPASLPGTIFNPLSSSDPVAAKKIKDTVVANAKSFRLVRNHEYGTPAYVKEVSDSIMRYSNFSMSQLGRAMGPSSRLHSKILSAYNDGKIYSVELVGAALRQGSFVQKMYNLGWTKPGFFDKPDDELALQHALARYHAFLDLMTSSPASFFVPTLDIDLVWHTHQLMPSKYETDCIAYVRRFVDHDDKIEELRLSSAFKITCQAWKDRFGMPYMHRGPPRSRYQRKHWQVPLTADLRSATHLCNHNTAHFMPKSRNHSMMNKLDKKLGKKKEKEDINVPKMVPNQEGWVLHRPPLPRAQNKNSDDASDDTNDRNSFSWYGAVFLVPVPISFAAGAISGCEADSGRHWTGAGGGNDGCGEGSGGSAGGGGGSSDSGGGDEDRGGCGGCGDCDAGWSGSLEGRNVEERVMAGITAL